MRWWPAGSRSDGGRQGAGVTAWPLQGQHWCPLRSRLPGAPGSQGRPPRPPSFWSHLPPLQAEVSPVSRDLEEVKFRMDPKRDCWAREGRGAHGPLSGRRRGLPAPRGPGFGLGRDTEPGGMSEGRRLPLPPAPGYGPVSGAQGVRRACLTARGRPCSGSASCNPGLCVPVPTRVVLKAGASCLSGRVLLTATTGWAPRAQGPTPLSYRDSPVGASLASGEA